MVSPKSRELSRSIFLSGRCLYQLLACACRSSQRTPNVCYLSTGSNVEQFLQSSSWLRSSILFVEKIQPIWREDGTQMASLDGEDRSIVLEIEKNILRTIDLIAQFLRPVSIEVLLKILNPFGHSWNMLQDDEDEEFPVTCTEVTALQPLKLGSMDG